MARIFISHSHSDEAIAYKLVNFLLAALRLEEEEILCTSNPDQGLSYSSSSITDQLKNQLKNSEALIVLITADSLHSAWIPFEAGSFWTTDKLIIPILGPGLTQNDLPGPLKSFLSIPIEVQDAEDKLNNATNQLAKSLNLQQEITRRRDYTLQEFCDALRAWQPQRPVTDPAPQEKIKQLKAQIQNLEATSQQEKEELERSLQSQIEKLKKQLDKERACKQQLEKLARRQFLKWAGLGSAGLVTAVVAREIFPGQSSTPESTKSLTPQPTPEPTTTSEAELDSFKFETVTVNQKGEIVERDSNKQAKFFKEDLGNGVNLDMVSIPGGKFFMGTEDEEIERLVKKYDWDGFRREKPQHKVTVQPFFIGKYPITQAQWKAIASREDLKVKRDLKPDPSEFKGDERPVEQVSWDEAVEFCQRLSKQTGTEYRLPSEAEWEYACRAETTTAFNFGETITDKLANYRASETYANEPKGEYREKTTSVGEFPPNAFGLYDMHGNVWEWCEDDWHDNYEGAPKDGSAWLSQQSSFKVLRGGSWDFNPWDCRSAYRFRDYPGYSDFNDGFRVACGGART